MHPDRKAAIHAAVTGKGKVPIRDGEKAALVEAFGVNLRIGARVTRGGESAAVGLEGKFDVSDIVDPGIANAESADAKRIKALVQLTGVEADISAFEIEGDGLFRSVRNAQGEGAIDDARQAGGFLRPVHKIFAIVEP